MWTNCRNTQFGMFGKWNFRYFWGLTENTALDSRTLINTLKTLTHRFKRAKIHKILYFGYQSMSVRCYSSSRNDSESSYAAVYLRCALPRLRTAMRLLVWVDDETKGAASVSLVATPPAHSKAGCFVGRSRSLKLYVHFTRIYCGLLPVTCVCLSSSNRVCRVVLLCKISCNER